MAKKKKRRSQKGTLERRENGIYYLRIVIKSIRIGKTEDGKWKYKQIKRSYSTHTSNWEDANKFRKNFVLPLQAEGEIEKLENLQAKIRCIEKGIEEEDKKKPALKVVDALECFLDEHPDIAAGTRKVYTDRWNRFIRFMDKKMGKGIAEMREVSAKMAEEFLDGLRRKTKGGTYNGYLMLFKLLWKELRKKAKLTCNPWLEYKRRDCESEKRRNLTTAELKSVLSSVEGEWKLLFALGLYTGMRLIDCCNLDWSSVDLSSNRLFVVPQKTKKRRPQPIPIPIHSDLYALLSAIPSNERTGKVVPECANAYNCGSINYRLKRIFEGCGIQTTKEGENGRKICKVGFHSLRSGFVTTAWDAGIPVPVIQAIVGHGTANMTAQYYQTSAKVLAQCIGTIPSLIGNLIRPRASITLYTDVIDLIKTKMLTNESIDECLIRILGNQTPATSTMSDSPIEKVEASTGKPEASTDSMRLAS